jgi:hypothetical protein
MMESVTMMMMSMTATQMRQAGVQSLVAQIEGKWTSWRQDRMGRLPGTRQGRLERLSKVYCILSQEYGLAVGDVHRLVTRHRTKVAVLLQESGARYTAGWLFRQLMACPLNGKDGV